MSSGPKSVDAASLSTTIFFIPPRQRPASIFAIAFSRAFAVIAEGSSSFSRKGEASQLKASQSFPESVSRVRSQLMAKLLSIFIISEELESQMYSSSSESP